MSFFLDAAMNKFLPPSKWKKKLDLAKKKNKPNSSVLSMNLMKISYD